MSNAEERRQFQQDYEEYKKMPGAETNVRMYPQLGQRTPKTHVDLFYFYQDTWAFKRIVELRPKSVVDVGSTALLVGCIAQMFPTISIDVRPLGVRLAGLTCKKASILDLPFADSSVELLSSLCVIEHIGLGRYDELLDPLGSVKALKEVARVLQPGGHFIMSTNVSHKSGLCFNAHRIFTKPQVLAMLPGFSIVKEAFFFPQPNSEKRINGLGDLRFFCVWCVDLVKQIE